MKDGDKYLSGDKAAFTAQDHVTSSALIKDLSVGFFGWIYVWICEAAGWKDDIALIVASIAKPLLKPLPHSPSSVHSRSIVSTSLTGRANPPHSYGSTDTTDEDTDSNGSGRLSPDSSNQRQRSATRRTTAVSTPVVTQARIDFSQNPVLSFGTGNIQITSQKELENAMYSYYVPGSRGGRNSTISFGGRNVRIDTVPELLTAFEKAKAKKDAELQKASQVRLDSRQNLGVSTLADQVASQARKKKEKE